MHMQTGLIFNQMLSGTKSRDLLYPILRQVKLIDIQYEHVRV